MLRVCRARQDNFNPLPRKEGDPWSRRKSRQVFISIHSLVKRETKLADALGVTLDISIHSLVKRETKMARAAGQPDRISIHSLVKRETKISADIRLASKAFQSTPS